MNWRRKYLDQWDKFLQVFNIFYSLQGYVGSISSLDTVTVVGLTAIPSRVTINGQDVNSFSYDDSNHSLKLIGLNSDMSKGFSIKWM